LALAPATLYPPQNSPKRNVSRFSEIPLHKIFSEKKRFLGFQN
jgi:hypothetical protein